MHTDKDLHNFSVRSDVGDNSKVENGSDRMAQGTGCPPDPNQRCGCPTLAEATLAQMASDIRDAIEISPRLRGITLQWDRLGPLQHGDMAGIGPNGLGTVKLHGTATQTGMVELRNSPDDYRSAVFEISSQLIGSILNQTAQAAEYPAGGIPPDVFVIFNTPATIRPAHGHVRVASAGSISMRCSVSAALDYSVDDEALTALFTISTRAAGFIR